MTIQQFITACDRLMPQGACYSQDNVGLQSGNPQSAITGILVGHDMEQTIVQEASRKKCNFIVCYHPLIFTPMQRIVATESVGAILLQLAEKQIGLFIVHTNFDAIAGGTSSLFASKLKLQDTRFLVPHVKSLIKIAVFVPKRNIDAVAAAMWDSGAGTIGEYSDCSFQSEGTGTFFGSDATHPAIGRKNHLEQVDEIRLEMICPRWRLPAVLQALIRTHPYEEPAYDIYPIENESKNFGMGTIGELPVAIQLQSFVAQVKKVCAIPFLKYTGNPRRRIRTVAIVGGSGGTFLNEAIRAGADAFITGDVRYHTFRAAHPAIALIDAGHAETERFVPHALVEMIRGVLRSSNNSHIRVFQSMKNTNPILYA